MGRTISLSLNEDVKGDAVQFIATYVIAHEGFHFWNGRWGGQNKSAGELEWLSEGFAEYYAMLISRRLGLVDNEAFLGFLAERRDAYVAALASGDSISSAATTKHSKPTSYDLIYNGGLMAAVVMDLEIRAATGGEKSLDDVVRAIHADFTDSPVALDMRALQKIVKRETGVNFDSLFRRNIRGTEPLDLAGALAKAGLLLQVEATDDGPAAQIARATSPTLEQAALYQGLVSGE